MNSFPPRPVDQPIAVPEFNDAICRCSNLVPWRNVFPIIGSSSVLCRLLQQMARRVMSQGYLAHRRLLHAAAVYSIWAARMEAAAAGRVDWARHLAREDDALALRAWIGERRCREQR